jgi:TolB-like protein/tetratricopeptide (TPR) repeat protein
MSAEVKKEIQFEIGHVLFVDIVGYSKLLITEQSEQLQKLKQIVRGTEQFRLAEAEGKLLRLPTGDGGALVFRTSPEAPVRCAVEISQELKRHPELRVRMGIHSGAVNEISDLNEQANIAGAGINIAQRVMDCGDAGHILLSRHLAEDLEQYPRWRAYLHDLGECEVKHGVRIGVVNLSGDGVGNAATPKKFETIRKHRAHVRWAAVAVALIVLAAIIGGTFFFSHRPTTSALRVLDKSIAVLPFENLSSDKENAFFTDGVQDEILTDLAKIADLKVISRTSVMQYKSGLARNLRKIGEELGVAHVVEGSVQRAANKVRVNAQLIDARTDRHLWAQTYDRDLADVFAIQSEIAEQIVSQLKSELSPQEKAAIEEKPTADLAAYDLYIRAKILNETAPLITPLQESLFEAVRLLNQAIQRDPAFALAYYQLAQAHNAIYFTGLDHTPSRLASAAAAIQSLARLRPGSGEIHLALAGHFYFGYLDYDRAWAELGLARQSLPNDSSLYVLAGYVDRRQGRWSESTKSLERAAELDPRNTTILEQTARSYDLLRRYADEERVLDRALALTPQDAALRVTRARIELSWHADPAPLISTIGKIVAEDSREATNIAQTWLEVSLCDRDFDSAFRALALLPIAGCQQETIPFPRAWCEGVVARLRGDDAGFHATFSRARTEAAKLVAEQSDYAEALCVLGMLDAALGNRDDAIREGRRAVELLPVTKDSIIGPLLVQNLALIYAWTGEKDLAFEQLAIATRIPGYLSYGELKLHPYWDPLRGDPRFEKIVASLAPKQ